ncbi:hypothetical protein HX819_17795 [Pseudomonas sp. D6002]|uniref:hypothetical protein n=1 Tax=Pseudomonas sp. D6002 TaxID=2738819 RepID=UPI0015A3A5C8|nr:hypothetical protein [Pseudomonas sp. D6002]NWB16278.1 hypothetical protein [Pseudomonas sp. D6002]
MRVPISLNDLNAGSGFSRLAKNLKRDWLGINPIALSEAQNLLARCLGYENYHAVRATAAGSDSNPDAHECPPLVDVMTQCVATMTAELANVDRCKAFNFEELQAEIFSWPFLQLSVYRQQYGHSDNRIVEQAIKAEAIKSALLTALTMKSSDSSYDILLNHDLPAMRQHYRKTPLGICPNASTPPPTFADANFECLQCPPFLHEL